MLSVLAGGKKAAELNFRSACEVADVFAKRLGLDEAVRASLAASFERWNGRGLPDGRKGTAIPRPMRIAQLSQELEVLARIEGIDQALDRHPPPAGQGLRPGADRPRRSPRRRAGGSGSNRPTLGMPRSQSHPPARRLATTRPTSRCSSWPTSPT